MVVKKGVFSYPIDFPVGLPKLSRDRPWPRGQGLEDVEAEVAPDSRPIEEIIEERRAALPPGACAAAW